MALAGLPPWLDVNPNAVLQARKAGSEVGLGIAQNQLRANQIAMETGRAMAEMAARSQENAARLAQAERESQVRQWETQQALAARTAAQQAEAERQAAALEETGRWHTMQNETDLARLAAQQGHWAELEAGKAQGEIRTLPNGELVRVLPNGTWEQVKPPSPEAGVGAISPTSLIPVLGSEANRANMLDRMYYPGFTESARSYVKQYLPGGGSLTNALPTVPSAKVPLDEALAQANEAIKAGKDKQAVSDRLFSLTGRTLPGFKPPQ